jgi:hypothetical protein
MFTRYQNFAMIALSALIAAPLLAQMWTSSLPLVPSPTAMSPTTSTATAGLATAFRTSLGVSGCVVADFECTR